MHLNAGLTTPSAQPLLVSTLEGLQCSLAQPTVKKEPITVEMLEVMVRNANSSGFLSGLRLITGISSVTEQSKTDQLRQGSELLIVRTNSINCPVTMLECYMERTFFCPIQKTKNGETLRQSGKISYSCLRDLFNKNGLHNCRVWAPHSWRSYYCCQRRDPGQTV